MGTRLHGLDELRHVLVRTTHFWQQVFTVWCKPLGEQRVLLRRAAAGETQRPVACSALFRGIDRIAGQHGIPKLSDAVGRRLPGLQGCQDTRMLIRTE